MIKYLLFTAFMVLGLASAALAFTGVLPRDNTPFTVQNLKALAPVPAAASCSTLTATKGTVATVSTTDAAGKYYLAVDYTATDAAGAPVPVKRYLGSNTAYQVRSSGTDIINKGFNQVVFKKFSTATATTVTVCTDRQ